MAAGRIAAWWRNARGGAGTPGDGASPSVAIPMIVMLALMAAIGATGLSLYRHYEREMRDDAQELVTAVARQKAQTLEVWLDQQASEAARRQHSAGLRRDLARLIEEGGEVTGMRERLAEEHWPGESVLLLGADGNALASTGQLAGVSAALRDRARAAAASGTSQMHFLHRDDDLQGSPVFLDYLVPLAAVRGTGQSMAVLVLRHDPGRFLFPLIQTWPGSSASAETLLVRAEGDRARYLNTLRRQADTAFRLARARTELTLPAVQAAFGLPRTEKSFDYGGAEVIADHRPVRGTDWHLVANIDTEEILQSTRIAAAAALALTLALVLAVGAGAVIFWRQQLRLFAATRQAVEGERNRLSKHLELMSRHANDAIFLCDEAGIILEANERAVERYGYARNELIAMQVSRLRAPEAADQAQVEAQLASGSGSRVYETVHRRKDGSEFPVEASLRVVEVEGRRFVQGVVRDISGRKRDHARILRLSRLRDALSGVNHAIVHAGNEQSLFDEVCAIIVARAGFRHAGIGIVESESGEVRWVASAGAGVSEFAQARRTVRTNEPEGRGLSGTAIREARHVVSQDFLNDPLTAHWHEFARSFGIGSSAAFPILHAGSAVGVINVSSRETDAFDAEALALLDEAAQDVSFALDNLERERARGRAEKRAADLMAIVNRSPVVFIKWGAGEERPVELVSDNIAQFGYSPEDFVSGGIAYIDIVCDEDRVGFTGKRVHAEREHEPVIFGEYRILTRDGRTRWVEDRTWIERDEDGRIRAYQGLVQDITARREAESALRDAEEQFRGLVEQSISGISIIQDGVLAYVNPRFAEIFGYDSADELTGREPGDLIAEKDRALVAENLRRRLRGVVRSVAYTFTGVRKDGTPVEIGVHGSVATYRGRAAVISVLQDITERKQAEDEVRRHVAELEQAMMATVRVASNIGEVRDPYTSGHERRVGELSAAIGAELGLSNREVEGLRVAGYLHDIGKLSVPSEILSKPGKISPTEFALIREHAQQGYEILKEVRFPWPVALVAQQHHERVNGTGYPQGLKGDAIILEARILAVADVVEAMGSHRPYRPGLGIEKALEEIERFRGERYDAQVADACLRLFREKGHQMPA